MAGGDIPMVLIDIESSTWFFTMPQIGFAHLATCRIRLTDLQQHLAGAVVIVSLAQPEYVLFLPNSYLPGLEVIRNTLTLGSVYPQSSNMSPLPPNLAQCVMLRRYGVMLALQF